MEFRKIKLSEIASVQTGPFGSQLHKEDYVEDGIPIITVEHLGENKILHRNLPLVGDEDYNRLAKYHLQKNDIVFSRVGSVDRRALVSEKEDGWMFSGRCLRVRVSDSEVNPIYLSYYFGTSSFKEYIRSIAVGATMPSINTKILSDIEIVLPSLEIQNKVSQVLNQLDSKIWLNEEIINKLEEVCSLLFKRWFIDFEFPNEQGLPYRSSGGDMVESELGWVPKLWCVSNLNEFAKEIIITGKTPSTKRTDYYAEQGYPFITIPDMHGNVFSTNTQRYLSIEGDLSQNKKRVPKNSLLVSCIATPGLVNITSEDSHFNQQINAFTPRFRDLYYLYFSLKNLSGYIRDLGSSGSTTLNLNKSQFSKIEIVKPTDDILEEFTNTVQPSFEQILNLTMENQKLRDLRDTLLPKLLSGEIEIPEESVVES